MAVTSTAIFAQALRNTGAAIATANTNRDGTGTIGTIFTAGSNGSVIERVDITATGNTTAGVVRLYVHNGSTAFLWKEILVGAITPSTTVAVFNRRVLEKLNLPSGWSLRASTHNAETFNVQGWGYDL
jgi:hypothetical protein